MLNNKYALITGSTSGIGRAIAEVFVKNGAKVILHSKEPNKLQEAIVEFEERGFNVDGICFDVSKPQSVKNGFVKLRDITKQLDILINNAGIMDVGSLAILSEHKLQKVFSTNVFGAFYVTQFASKMMIKQKKGVIVNIGSIMGEKGEAFHAVYSASKAALSGFTKSIAKELVSYNIRCNTIAPGVIRTAMSEKMSKKDKDSFIERIELKRFGEPEEVANVALFLVSELSSYITGKTIEVDGGMRE